MADDVVYVPVAPSAKGFMATVVKEASGAARAGSAAMQQEFARGGRESGRSAARGVDDGLSRGNIGVNSVKARMAKLAAQMRGIGRTAGHQGALGINDGLNDVDYTRVGDEHGRSYGRGFVRGVRAGLVGIAATFGLVNDGVRGTVRHISTIATATLWASRIMRGFAVQVMAGAVAMQLLAGQGLAKLAGWLKTVSFLAGRLARDVARATAAVLVLSAAVRTLGRVMRVTRVIGMLTVGLAALIGVASTAAPALVALAAAIVTLGSAAGGIAIAGLSALGASIAGLKVGLMGVGDAFKEMGTSGAGSAAKVVDNTKEIARAERGLTKAVEAEKDAQEDVSKARDDARKKLRDLDLQLRGAALSERDAQLSLREARADLAKGGFESGTERERAVLAVEEAELRLAEVQRDNNDLAKDAATTRRKGVEGSDEVVAAQERLRDATEATRDAQEALADARQPKDTGASAAADKQAEAMAKLSTNARSFVESAMGVKPAWDAMQRGVQDTLFAGLAERLPQLADTWLPRLGGALRTVTGGFNTGARSVVDWMNSAQGIPIVSSWLRTSSGMAAQAGTALGALAPGLASIAAGAGEAFAPMVAGATEGAKSLSNMLVQAQQSGRIKQYFTDAFNQVKTVIQNVTAVVGPLWAAFLRLGQISASGLAPGMRSIGAAITQATPGLVQMAERLMPALGQALTNLAPIIPGIVQAFSPWATILAVMAPHIATVMSHLGPMAPVLLTLAVTVKAITMAMTLYNAVMAVASVAQGVFYAATGRSTAGLRGNMIALAAHRVAMLAGAVASGIFGAALAVATSPITWIIVAIGALIAGLVLFFTKTEIGRKIWTTAWNSIKAAVSVVWSWLQQTVWPALMTALRAVGAVVMWLWRNVITPAFNAIKWVIGVAWNAAKLYFSLWVGLFRNVVGPVVMWLWNTVIGPAMRAIGAVIGWVWNTLIKPVWDSFRRSLDILGEAFKFLWNNVIKPTWDALGAGISWVVDNIISPAWEALKSGLSAVGGFFDTIVDGIGNAWDKIKSFVAKPINFVLGTVWNKGLLPAWNTIAGFLPGLNPMKPVAEVAFKDGGPVPMGAGAKRGKDSVHALMMPDEHVWDVRDVKRAGGHGAMYRMRNMVDSGRPFTWTPGGLRPVSEGGPLPRFEKGGAVAAGQKLSPMPGEGGLQAIGQLMRRLIFKLWPKIKDIGGYRQDDYEEHPSGRALDVMVGSDKKTGDQVNAFAHANSPKFPLQHSIWQQAMWYPPKMRREPMGDRGSPTQNHMDHPHLWWKPQNVNPNVVPEGLVTDGFGGPSAAEMLGIVKKKITEIIDKALNPIKQGMASVIGSPPPEWLGIPPKIFDITKTKAIETAFNLAAKLGDKLKGAYDAAKKVTSIVTNVVKQPFKAIGGLFRDQGGYLPKGLSLVRNETGKPEAVLNWDQLTTIKDMMEAFRVVFSGQSPEAASAAQQRISDEMTARHEQEIKGLKGRQLEDAQKRHDMERKALEDSTARIEGYRASATTIRDTPMVAAESMAKDTAEFFGFGRIFDAVASLIPRPGDAANTGTAGTTGTTALGATANQQSTTTATDPVYGDGTTIEQGQTPSTTVMPDLNHEWDPKGGAEQWRPMAKEAMKRVGFDYNNPAQVDAMIKQIQSESGGNPGIVQGVQDVNSGGNEAVGLLQVIPGTFATHRDPSLPDDRRNPMANMVAALRYYKSRYGMDLTTTWGHGHGYDSGGWLNPGLTMAVNKTLKPEAVLTAGQWSSIDSMLDALPSAAEFKSVADLGASVMRSSGRMPADTEDGTTSGGRGGGPLVVIEKQYTHDPDEAARKTGREVRRATRSEQLVGGW
ncbi:transglycosylase SLT domain-containing protein [Gordonia alkanivorans]|uniref:transglycosylase SLT domain-containing protein n=1 Tax=Gordonia alkanivorans TaxID=84096 RepID=UPI0024B71917|nr:transglycosylase SLT domain-containing protein [Gordonia alkanivorans]MDJ0006519.1 transglycosylase SLT domain-containing protein [Gordonia alkanivorans]MDJ0492147.1 transglycosylase SLT domain-containing protein [Gordonia alkanivorans]